MTLFFCPSAIHGKFGLLFPEKASSHSTALPRLYPPPPPPPPPPLLSAVFSCFHTNSCEVYSFTTDAYEVFNVRTNLGACQATTFLTRKNSHTFFLYSWRRRGSNLWSLDLESDALSTEPGLPRRGAEGRGEVAGGLIFCDRSTPTAGIQTE